MGRSLVVVCALFAWAGCGSGGGGGTKNPALATSLAGQPTQAELTVAEMLSTSLTADELDHLLTTDWSTLTADAFLKDDKLVKAFTVVGPKIADQPGGLGPTSAAMSSALKPEADACPDPSCQQCQDELKAGIAEVQAALPKTAGNVGWSCGAFALSVSTGNIPIGILSAGLCVAALKTLLMHVKSLVNNLGCALKTASAGLDDNAAVALVSSCAGLTPPGPCCLLDYPSKRFPGLRAVGVKVSVAELFQNGGNQTGYTCCLKYVAAESIGWCPDMNAGRPTGNYPGPIFDFCTATEQPICMLDISTGSSSFRTCLDISNL